MIEPETPAKPTKRARIFRTSKEVATHIDARAKDKGIGFYEAAEQLILLGHKRALAIETYAAKNRKGARP
jgi:hypothetical protein